MIFCLKKKIANGKNIYVLEKCAGYATLINITREHKFHGVCVFTATDFTTMQFNRYQKLHIHGEFCELHHDSHRIYAGGNNSDSHTHILCQGGPKFN